MALKIPASAEIEGDMPSDLKITVTQPEMVVTASGTVDALSYEFEGPSVTAKFEPGDTAAAAQGSFEVALTDLSGKYLVEEALGFECLAKDHAGELAMTIAVNTRGLRAPLRDELLGGF